jgi:very-short-patch-repair endonuclease
MRAQGLTDTDKRLLGVANGQFGLLRHADLVAHGLSRSVIARRLAAGRLTRVHDLVYAFGHTVLRDEGRWLAALWACGPDAVLSHATGAAYHRWTTEDPTAPVHVTTTGTIRSREGIVVHRVRRLQRVDVFRPHPFAVTTMPRTLVDLGDVLAWDEYRALADGLASLRVDKIRQAQARAPKRRGSPLVRRLIDADDAHTKSAFERRFLRFLHTHHLPRPDALNARVAGHRADCVFREQRLVVELDGRAFHRRRAQMRADRRRDTDYQLAGHRILRLVWDDLHPGEAARTAERVRRMLDAGRRP